MWKNFLKKFLCFDIAILTAIYASIVYAEQVLLWYEIESDVEIAPSVSIQCILERGRGRCPVTAEKSVYMQKQEIHGDISYEDFLLSAADCYLTRIAYSCDRSEAERRFREVYPDPTVNHALHPAKIVVCGQEIPCYLKVGPIGITPLNESLPAKEMDAFDVIPFWNVEVLPTGSKLLRKHKFFFN